MSETSLTNPRRPSGRHPVNVGHLVMGVAFLGLTVVWALVATDTVRLDESNWLLPLPWLAAGSAGLLATVLRRRPAYEETAYDPRQPDWSQDWKQELRASKQAWKADLRRQKQEWRDDVRRSHEAWKHNGPPRDGAGH